MMERKLMYHPSYSPFPLYVRVSVMSSYIGRDWVDKHVVCSYVINSPGKKPREIVRPRRFPYTLGPRTSLWMFIRGVCGVIEKDDRLVDLWQVDHVVIRCGCYDVR